MHRVWHRQDKHRIYYCVQQLRSGLEHGHGHRSRGLSSDSLQRLGGGDGSDHVHVLSHAHVLGVGWFGLRFVSDHHLPHGLGGRGNDLLRAYWAAKQAAQQSAH